LKDKPVQHGKYGMSMKNRILLISVLLLILTINASAQQIERNESALVYYMPKTELLIDVEYERIDAKVGAFYQYSQRYLGVDDVVKENKVTYRIKSVTFQTRTVPDKDRAYTIKNNAYNIGIGLTSDGILCGINTRNSIVLNNKFKYVNEPVVVQTAPKTIVPLGEEQLLSGSQAKMAESTAKQIYRLRESRFNILSGEAENMPTDGEAVKLMLDQLNEQEEALCALFVGTKEITRLHAYYPIDLSKEQNGLIAFRFSSLVGPVDANDLSGAPIVVDIEHHKIKYATVPKEKKAQKDAIYYNIPGDASVIVKQGTQILAQKDLKVAQLGIEVPIETALLFKKVLINPETGLISQVNL